jgi:hypothetical protein
VLAYLLVRIEFFTELLADTLHVVTFLAGRGLQGRLPAAGVGRPLAVRSREWSWSSHASTPEPVPHTLAIRARARTRASWFPRRVTEAVELGQPLEAESTPMDRPHL